MTLSRGLLGFAALLHVASGLSFTSSQSINLWRLDHRRGGTHEDIRLPELQQGLFQIPTYKKFTPRWFDQPLDHFANEEGYTFKQRYWVNDRHYQAGGPVFVLDGGETSGSDRLPFLDHGILEILANATGGLGIVLEHRYYGESIPVSNFSTDSLRWLNNAQAAADSARFMAHVKIDGIEEDVTATKVPWIYYGGSYAGARAAHMRVLYPDLVFGAIASSAVTHAAMILPEYHEVIRQAADPKCSKHLEDSIQAIDMILTVPALQKPLKSLFGLGDLEHDDDFVELLTAPLGSWQAKNWDPEVGSTAFDNFCEALAAPPSSSRMPPLLPGGLEVPFTVYNYAKYIKEHYVSRCPEENTIEDCFGSHDDSKFDTTDLSDTWRLWLFQVCTEWAFFFTAPLDPTAPTIVSRLLTLDVASRICHQAFPPGNYFQVPWLPNITVVNSLGDFAIGADRLAIIDGEVDPWRPATPHSQYALDRPDTLLRPFKLIPNGVHHWDENGLEDMSLEPHDILQIHLETIDFVKQWLKDWDKAATD